MAWLNELPGMGAAETRAAKAMSFPVGAVSPLWLAFGAATSAGLAFWLATRWARPTNLEALLKAPAKALGAAVEAIPDAPALAPEVVETVVAALNPAQVIEIVLEAAEEVVTAIPVVVVEAPAEPVIDTAAAPVVEAVAVSAPVIEPVAEAPAAPLAPDDLTRIAGIGPKLALALAERGVTRFADLAAWGAEELAEADKALSLKGRAVRDAWVAQAKRFAEA